jgi:DNA-binding NarL/FixJ family response regulator
VNKNTVSLLIVDDSDVIRKAIKRLLAEESSIEIVGEAEDFRQAISMAALLKPDVILLDLHMGDDFAYEAEFIKSQFSSCGSTLLVMSLFSEEEDEDRKLAEGFGAIAMLDKADLYDVLIPAIRKSSRSDKPADSNSKIGRTLLGRV